MPFSARTKMMIHAEFNGRDEPKLRSICERLGQTSDFITTTETVMPMTDEIVIVSDDVIRM